MQSPTKAGHSSKSGQNPDAGVGSGPRRPNYRKSYLLALSLAMALVLLWYWQQQATGADIFNVGGRSMGTSWSVSIDQIGLNAQDIDWLVHLPNWCQTHFNRLEQTFSTWIADSEINQINRGIKLNGYSEDMLAVMAATRELGLHNEAFLDFGLQQTLFELGFEINDAAADADIANPDIDTADRMYNFSAFVKGFAIDKLAQQLAQRGYGDTLIELGGEIVARCTHRSRAWRVAIQHPQLPTLALPIEFIELCNQALATSGDYQNFKMIDGQPHSHLIDPQTHRPKTNSTRSASVISDKASVADAYATAFSISGLERSDQVHIHKPMRVLFLQENMTGEIEKVWKNFYPAGDD